MTPPVRPEFDPTAAIAALKSQGAPDEAIHAYLQSKGYQPVGHDEGVIARGVKGAGNALQQLATHPIDTITGMARGAGKSLMDAVLSPGVGEARHNPNLSKGGNSSGRPIDTTPYDAEHGGVTTHERNVAGAQTVANLAFPSVAGGVAKRAGGSMFAHALGLSAAGGLAGAAQSPDDPGAGAVAGGLLAPVLGSAGKGVGKLASGAADIAGRPMESRPLIKAGPVSIGRIEGVTDRAARLNAPTIAKSPALPESGKPLAPVDAGIPTQRLARGLKTSSPAAEAVFRESLTPRAEGAVDRVINHGLELTGLKSRENALGVIDDLIAQRAQHGRENFRPVFDAHPEPISHPAIHDILQTPAGQQALKRGSIIAANRGQKIGMAGDASVPPAGIPADQWDMLKSAMERQGIGMPEGAGGQARLAPTLEQAHHIKLGFDDLLQSAPEPGSGGSGPNNAAAIRALKNKLLTVLDEHAPDYGKARKTFADESDLIRAAETGRNLFKLHPQEAAKAFAEMPEAARDVARRTGFDAMAERVENGPADVEKGARKPRDLARMKLLFPDDASFATFQEGLKHEATMHATTKGVLDGSTTADKLADMAGMAGVTLPDVMKVISGHPLAAAAGMGKRLLSQRMTQGAERLAAERAKLLTAGADGNAGARVQATQRMAPGTLLNAIQGRERALPPDHDPTLPAALDRTMEDRGTPSPAAEAIRAQVDEMNRRSTVQAHRPKQKLF